METKKVVVRSVISCVFFISAMVILLTSPHAIANVMTMTFEEFLGQDGVPIGSFYPGVRFEALTPGGEDWIVFDPTSKPEGAIYNVSSWPSGQQWGDGNYWMYGYVTTWTSQPGAGGKIIFENAGTVFVELGYCCATHLTLTAYDANDIAIDSDIGLANLRFTNDNDFGPGTLRVDAPSGNLISYVIIHDEGNLWTVDNISVGTAIQFTKDDNLADGQCTSPEQTITYSICFDNTYGQTIKDPFVIDWLPDGVDYDFILSIDPLVFDENYNMEEHYYRWELEDIAPGDANCLELTVTVNYNAVPGGYLHNVAELWGTIWVSDPNDPNNLYEETRVIATASKDTRVCCYIPTPEVLYVDQNAVNGANNGLDWPNAFLDLQSALEYARSAVCGEVQNIYVAQGVYSPGDSENDSFDLRAIPGISLYGGFPTGGGDVASPKKYVTTLTGLIDEETIADSVVTMGEDTLLSGFTITMALASAISGEGVDFAVEHCVVKDNFQLGINAENGNVAVQWCNIRSNGTTGIQHTGEGYTLTIDNSWILRNGEYGINCVDSTPTIRNSIVSESDMTEQGRQGIRLYRPTYQPKIYNVTIANNKAQGVYFEDDADASGDPNNLDYPDLQNSIVYYNNKGGPQLTGINADLHANFCCIQDCNEPGTTNFNAEPGFAYAVDPNGTPDPNNYHLSANSVCIDQANPDPAMGYELQVDFDNELRQYGDGVDVGADEVYDCYDDYLSNADVYNARDFDADGLVNLNEFRLFSVAWLTYDPNHPLCDPNNPNYVSDPNAPGYIDADDKLRFNPICDLDEDLHVGLSDLIVFLDDWLWVACWRTDILEQQAMQMLMDSSVSSEGVGATIPTAAASASEPISETNWVAATEQSAVDGQAAVQEPPVVEEKSIAEQIDDLQDSIEFLEQIWNQEPDIQQEINAEEWQEFMNSVKNSLLGLQTETIQIE